MTIHTFPLKPSNGIVNGKAQKNRGRKGSLSRDSLGKENALRPDSLPPPPAFNSLPEKGKFSVEVIDSTGQTQEQANLLAKADSLRKQLAEAELLLRSGSSRLPKTLVGERRERENTPAQAERSRFRTVRFFQDFKKAGGVAQVVQFVFFLAILSVNLFIDTTAFILASISEGVLSIILRSGILKQLAIDTAQGVLGDPMVRKQTIDFGADLIDTLGEKGAVLIIALIRNENTLLALANALTRLLESNDVKKGIDNFVNSRALRKTISKFIGQQGGTLLSLTKSVLSDKEMERILAEFASKFVADITTGTASGIADNVKKAVSDCASSAKSSVQEKAESVKASVRSTVLSGLYKFGKAIQAARHNADEYAVRQTDGARKEREC